MQPGPARQLLLIEDDPDLRELLPEILEDAGFGVVAVDSFDAAVAALQRSAYDLVLSDFRDGNAPVDASWTQLAGLQRLAGPAPIGICSAWNLSEGDVADRGFAFLLRKPFGTEQLFEHLVAHVPSAPVSDAHSDAIRAYFAALERGAWDRVAALCAEDVVYELPGDDPRHGRTITGRRELADFAAEIFADFAEPRFEVESIRALPRGALARYRSSWKRPTGGRALSDGVVLFQFRGDEIARIGVRTDLRALTAAPA